MEKKIFATRFLTVTGTVLAWFPILATIVTSIAGSIGNKKFLMDFLMPAELGLFFTAGGIALAIAAVLAKAHYRWIIFSFTAAEALLLGLLLVAQASGLASGELLPEAERVFSIIVFTMLGFHILCMILTDIGAAFLWKDIMGPVFRRRKLS